MSESSAPMRAWAVGALAALVLTACGDGGAEDGAAPSTDSSGETVFDPHIEVDEAMTTLEVTAPDAEAVRLHTPYPDATVTGVDPEIAESFTQAVAENHLSRVEERLRGFEEISMAECVQELDGEAGEGLCEREAGLRVVNAGVYEDYGTVATSSGFVMGSRDRNFQVHSVTMDLRTGEIAELDDFFDLEDMDSMGRAVEALYEHENWEFCETTPPPSHIHQAEAFSPAEEGLVLLWPTNTRPGPQDCPVDQIIVPWEDAGTADDDDQASEAGAAVAEDVNGRWCPTPESSGDESCVTVELPDAVYDHGAEVGITEHGSPWAHDDGSFEFAGVDAPFGSFYPAGVPIPDLPDYYPGEDLPDQDRIWNGQSGVMLLREQ